MRTKSSGFFILHQDRLIAGLVGLMIGIVAAQLHPAITQASASILQPSPSPQAIHARVDLNALGKPHPAVPAKLSPLLTPAPTPTPAAVPAPAAPQAAPAAAAAPAQPNGLVGSIGYARAGGNCVNEPGVNNPRNGNPIGWPVLSETPTIGATALFTWNHTGVVTGIWANGDVEVRHQNYWGGTHRFPRSMFRGFR